MKKVSLVSTLCTVLYLFVLLVLSDIIPEAWTETSARIVNTAPNTLVHGPYWAIDFMLGMVGIFYFHCTDVKECHIFINYVFGPLWIFHTSFLLGTLVIWNRRRVTHHEPTNNWAFPRTVLRSYLASVSVFVGSVILLLNL